MTLLFTWFMFMLQSDWQQPVHVNETKNNPAPIVYELPGDQTPEEAQAAFCDPTPYIDYQYGMPIEVIPQCVPLCEVFPDHWACQ